MGIINVTSDRKNVTLDSDVILYILMNGKIAEIHIVGGRVYETRTALKDLEGLLYTVRKKKQIVAEIQEKQKIAEEENALKAMDVDGLTDSVSKNDTTKTKQDEIKLSDIFAQFGA